MCQSVVSHYFVTVCGLFHIILSLSVGCFTLFCHCLWVVSHYFVTVCGLFHIILSPCVCGLFPIILSLCGLFPTLWVVSYYSITELFHIIPLLSELFHIIPSLSVACFTAIIVNMSGTALYLPQTYN